MSKQRQKAGAATTPTVKRKRGRPSKAFHILAAVDVGNVTLLCAYVNGKLQIVLVPDPDGFLATPAVIAFENGDPSKPLFGRAAANYRRMHPEWACTLIKRGRGEPDFVGLVDKDGRPWTGEELERLFVQWRIKHLEQTLEQPVEGILATVPANFTDAQRRATMNVVESAGWKCIGTINEPTAAALAYAEGKVGTFLIVDIGGGTTDVTALLAEEGNVFTVLASSGRNDLAGQEFTSRLFQLCVEHAATKGISLNPEDNPRDCVMAELECESGKRDLASQEKVTLMIPTGNALLDIAVTRERFAELCADLVASIGDLVSEVLTNAGLKPDDIDKVVLAGGGSRTVCVQDALAEKFGADKIARTIDPEAAVATGACHAIGLKIQERVAEGDTSLEGKVPEYLLEGSVSVREITSHDIGLAAVHETGDDPFLAPVVPRGTALPASETRLFGLTKVEDEDVNTSVVVLEGKAHAPASQANVLAEFPMGKLPAGPKEGRIKIRMEVSADGLVTVTATDTYTGKAITNQVEKRAAVKGSKAA
jgi:molecular chaperone DnaK